MGMAHRWDETVGRPSGPSPNADRQLRSGPHQLLSWLDCSVSLTQGRFAGWLGPVHRHMRECRTVRRHGTPCCAPGRRHRATDDERRIDGDLLVNT
jgi:hypothetical protein